jgi:hypothetical protein
VDRRSVAWALVSRTVVLLPVLLPCRLRTSVEWIDCVLRVVVRTRVDEQSGLSFYHKILPKGAMWRCLLRQVDLPVMGPFQFEQHRLTGTSDNPSKGLF